MAGQDRGPQALKGVLMPVLVYRVLRESDVQSRFEVAVRTGLTPLVGREEELGLLRRRWEQAKFLPSLTLSVWQRDSMLRAYAEGKGSADAETDRGCRGEWHTALL